MTKPNMRNKASKVEVTDDTIVSGIQCTRCGNTLPPHTVRRHLNVSDVVHTCPHLA